MCIVFWKNQYFMGKIEVAHDTTWSGSKEPSWEPLGWGTSEFFQHLTYELSKKNFPSTRIIDSDINWFSELLNGLWHSKFISKLPGYFCSMLNLSLSLFLSFSLKVLSQLNVSLFSLMPMSAEFNNHIIRFMTSSLFLPLLNKDHRISDKTGESELVNFIFKIYFHSDFIFLVTFT